MSKAQRILERASAKLQYSLGLNLLYAYLTPTEFHALLNVGLKPSVGAVIPDRKDPQPKPQWYYFKPVRGEYYIDNGT